MRRIISGNENCNFDNPERKKLWIDGGEPYTAGIKQNIHGHKVI